MAKSKYYRIEFDIKVHNHSYRYIIDYLAETKPEAIAKAKEDWSAKHREHMFHIVAHPLKDTETIYSSFHLLDTLW